LASKLSAGLRICRRQLFGLLRRVPAELRQSDMLQDAGHGLDQLSQGARKALFFTLAALAAGLALLLVTQPFNNLAQFIFVLLLWGVAMVVRRVPGQFATLMLIVLSLTVSCRYMWWRYPATLNVSEPLDMLFGS